MWQLLIVLSLPTVTLAIGEACRYNNHTNGSWVPITIPTNKSFLCCGGLNRFSKGAEKDDFLQMKEHCLQTNTVQSYLEIGPTTGPAQCGDDCCKCDREDDTRFLPGKREKYEWIPHHCVLHPWNATWFCELLGPRVLLLVGDSTMQQTSSTLMSMVSSNGGTCGSHIIFGRNDFVTMSARQQKHFGEFVDTYNPDLTVISVGAHIEDEGDFWTVLDGLHKILNLRKSAGSKLPTIIFKSPNPPHLACDLHQTPVDQFVPNAHKVEDKYHFERFYELDAIMQSYARNVTNESGFKLLSMEPLYLRPDAHVFGAKKDCMHYCQPGPLDLFSVLLQQMMANGEV